MGLVYPLPTQKTAVRGKEINLENYLMKTVLVVGGGGREHAIVDALNRSPQVGKIYCAPGNAGTSLLAENVPLKDTDVEGLKAFALEHEVDLTVVGPEAALAVGIVDAFRAVFLLHNGENAERAAVGLSALTRFASSNLTICGSRMGFHAAATV